jgi:hypothetical protein
MNEATAVQLVTSLVVNTTGWNDDAVEAMISMMASRWDDERAGIEAVNSVVNSWTNMSRPTWGVMQDSYRNARRRELMEAPTSLPSSYGKTIPFHEGQRIAARTYSHECRSRDPETDVHIRSGFRKAEPNPKLLDKWLGLSE